MSEIDLFKMVNIWLDNAQIRKSLKKQLHKKVPLFDGI